MALSEIIRFTLRSSVVADFIKLRQQVSKVGEARSQYYGNSIQVRHAALPVKRDEVCWVIQWPEGSDMRTSPAFRSELDKIVEGDSANSLLLQFKDSQLAELNKGLESPLCEFAIINLVPDAPQSDVGFKASMQKTYTDCYRMDGFAGGEWSYALNTNDTDGGAVGPSQEQWLQGTDRRLACYCLGWQSREAHETASQGPIFAEEMDKLMPWFGPGSGAWYVPFERHVDEL